MGLRKPSAFEPLREVVEREHARDLPGLIAQLRSGDADRRRWAARDLVQYQHVEAMLGGQLLGEREPSVREALFTTLTTLGTEAAAGALLPLLRTEDAQLRNGAIEALMGMPRAVAPRIAALLHDSDPDVRIFTVNLLGDLRHEQVPDWLLTVLKGDSAVNVVAAAIEVMAEVGQPPHIAALRAAVQRFANDPLIGFAADMAIERIEAP